VLGKSTAGIMADQDRRNHLNRFAELPPAQMRLPRRWPENGLWDG
jgi:hypothetical protein